MEEIGGNLTTTDFSVNHVGTTKNLFRFKPTSTLNVPNLSISNSDFLRCFHCEAYSELNVNVLSAINSKATTDFLQSASTPSRIDTFRMENSNIGVSVTVLYGIFASLENHAFSNSNLLDTPSNLSLNLSPYLNLNKNHKNDNENERK